jgi:hypothetical protein
MSFAKECFYIGLKIRESSSSGFDPLYASVIAINTSTNLGSKTASSLRETAQKKVQFIYDTFKKAPRAWEKFKSLLGLGKREGLNLLIKMGKAIKRKIKEAKQLLPKLGRYLYKEMPILAALYEVLQEKNSWDSMIEKAVNKLPNFVLRGLNKIKTKTISLAKYLDCLISKSKVLKTISTPAKIGLFLWAWDWQYDLNAVAVVAGLTGQLDFSDVIALLSGEGIEALLGSLFGNGPLSKLIIEIGVTSVMAVIVFREVMYLKKMTNAPSFSHLAAILRETNADKVVLVPRERVKKVKDRGTIEYDYNGDLVGVRHQLLTHQI